MLFFITLVERDDNLKSFKLYNNLALKSIKNFVSNTEGKCTCLNTYKKFTKTDHILSQELQEKKSQILLLYKQHSWVMVKHT